MRAVISSSFALAMSVAFVGDASSQDAAVGERAFRARCGTCHAVEPGQNKIGPSLHAVVDRKIASLEGFRYSDGMKSVDMNWDEATLERFLANPRDVAPGTSMNIRTPNANDRGNIIAYLKSLSGSEPK